MPTRFERWMRSKLSAITARTPSSSGPLAAQSRDEPEPYSLPARYDQRHVSWRYCIGGVEDGHLLAVGQVAREAAFRSAAPAGSQADVGEGAAHHDLVVAAPRAVGVEVRRLDAVRDQVLAGRAVGLDGAGGRDVIGGDAVAQHGQHPRAAGCRSPPAVHAACRQSTADCGCR